MSDSPFVSIIIPVYRAKDTIERAVRSALDQTYGNFEVVLASDDGVNYTDLLSSTGVSDERIREVSTGGVGTGDCAARNTALFAAEGDMIASLDADDAFNPERLASMVPIASAFGAAVDNTGVHDTNGRLYKTPFTPRADTIFRIDENDILMPRIPYFPVFRKEVAGNGWPTVAFAGDVIFNLELMSRAGGMGATGKTLYNYFKRDGSMTQSAETFDIADKGYVEIIEMLDEGALELDDRIRRAALTEFEDNRHTNRVFQRYLREGRCDSLEAFLDMTENGRAPWLQTPDNSTEEKQI